MSILKKNKKSHLVKNMFFDEGVDVARYDQVRYSQLEKITEKQRNGDRDHISNISI